MPKPRVLAIGECMLELSPASDGGPLQLGYGGDTLNTSVYLARLDIQVSYLTALGDDGHSDHMLAGWLAEGIDTSLVLRREGRLPGLYLINLDARGERSFHYWRREAPVRQLFDDEHATALALHRAGEFDFVYLTGITLSLFDPAARDRLFELLNALRSKGAKVVFDSNYRPAGWDTADIAREAIGRQLALTDLVLPTFDDEQTLYGDRDAEACLARLAAAGASEIVLKQGAAGCIIQSGQQRTVIAAQSVENVVDSTAAGDAFNAGYLAARACGEPTEAAARLGHALAAAVIRHPGAIIPADAMP